MLAVIARGAVNGKLLVRRKVHLREAICVWMVGVEVVVVVVVVEPGLELLDIECVQHAQNLPIRLRLARWT